MGIPSALDLSVKESTVKTVSTGETAVLACNSNDYNHNFFFWLFGNDKIIGPSNDYDESKYKYEVLSGKLHINHVTSAESGFYRCFSKKLDGSTLSVGEVEMIVSGSSFSSIDAVKIVAIIVSIIVLITCAVIYSKLRKDWNRYDGRSIIQVDDTEEEDGDEVYNPTTTTTSKKEPVAGPSRNPSSDHLFYGIDNHGLDTDFNSVFENIQIKSPASLI